MDVPVRMSVLAGSRNRRREIRIGTDALDVMMMAFLRQADFGLETEHLVPVFAQPAVHLVFAAQDLLHAIGKGVEDQRMIA